MTNYQTTRKSGCVNDIGEDEGHLMFLEDDLREYIHEELKERGIEHTDIKVYYSLSYSQGDGLMFESTLTMPNGNVYVIKQSGHYTHERSTEITGYDENDKEKGTGEFEEDIYIPICTAVRDRGYQAIEYTQSDEYARETCEANEYTFLESGEMFNE